MTKQQRIGVLVWLAMSVFFYLSGSDYYQAAILIGNPPSLESKRFVVFCLVMLAALVGWFYIFLRIWKNHQSMWLLEWVWARAAGMPVWLRWPLAGFFLVLPAGVLEYSSIGLYNFIYWFRFGLLFASAFAAAMLVLPPGFKVRWLLNYAALVMLAAVIFTIGDWFTGITSYPFSNGWSEGNRMWDYSIMFGSSRYLNPDGKPIYVFIEEGRQFLWALPFLLPGLDIYGMRLWNALLWIIPLMLFGWSMVIGTPHTGRRWIWQAGFGLWVFLFLSQGPIYPPLIISAILVVVAVRLRWLLVGMLLVVLSTYYAQNSRWIWMYAPGLWAGMLALLDVQSPGIQKGRWKQLIRPVLLGLAGYFGAQLLPGLISAYNSGFSQPVGVSLMASPGNLSRQPLLWERLWPNPTYPTGIVLALIWVAGPLAVFLSWMAVRRYWKVNWIQSLSMAIPLAAFLGVGLVISVKIGGGSNLHNLDQFLVSLVLIAGWILRSWISDDFKIDGSNPILLILLSFVILFPATNMVQFGETIVYPRKDWVDNSMRIIQSQVENSKKVGPVLFLDQRQLLTFGYVKDVPLVVDYEKKYMMDKAMAGDADYFAKFYKDLDEHRFSLIISEPFRRALNDEGTRNFGEENNAWVKWVSLPILRGYVPLITLDEVGVQLLVPRENH